MWEFTDLIRVHFPPFFSLQCIIHLFLYLLVLDVDIFSQKVVQWCKYLILWIIYPANFKNVSFDCFFFNVDIFSSTVSLIPYTPGSIPS